MFWLGLIASLVLTVMGWRILGAGQKIWEETKNGPQAEDARANGSYQAYLGMILISIGLVAGGFSIAIPLLQGIGAGIGSR